MSQSYAATTGVDTTSGEQVHKAVKHVERMDATALIDTAGAVTYTAAQILDGIIHRDCAGSARTDVLPTAALLVNAMRDPAVGDIVKCLIINGSDAAETITIDAGSGGTFAQVAGSRIVPQNTSRMIYIRITGVSTPAYVPYM